MRGINVGNIRIKMLDLKTAFEDLGFKEVKTYLQTGNVVFDADKALIDIKLLLEKKLSETFHYDAYVLMYAFDALADIIARYPFERTETHHSYVIFIDNTAVFEELKTLAENLETESKLIAFGNTVFYWQVKHGESTNTVFSKIIAKAKYKKNVTVRNLNTLEKMS